MYICSFVYLLPFCLFYFIFLHFPFPKRLRLINFLLGDTPVRREKTQQGKIENLFEFQYRSIMNHIFQCPKQRTTAFGSHC